MSCEWVVSSERLRSFMWIVKTAISSKRWQKKISLSLNLRSWERKKKKKMSEWRYYSHVHPQGNRVFAALFTIEEPKREGEDVLSSQNARGVPVYANPKRDAQPPVLGPCCATCLQVCISMQQDSAGAGDCILPRHAVFSLEGWSETLLLTPPIYIARFVVVSQYPPHTLKNKSYISSPWSQSFIQLFLKFDYHQTTRYLVILHLEARSTGRSRSHHEFQHAKCPSEPQNHRPMYVTTVRELKIAASCVATKRPVDFFNCSRSNNPGGKKDYGYVPKTFVRSYHACQWWDTTRPSSNGQ